MKYHISALIDLPRLQGLMEALYQATGINHALIDRENQVLIAVGWQEVCTHFHRVNPVSCARCRESDQHIFSHLRDGPYVGYRCLNGLVDYATPVVIEGEHLASVFTGQMFHEPPDLAFFRRQAADLGFDEEAYLAAVAKVKVVPQERMGAIMAFLSEQAGMLASAGMARLRQWEAEAELQAINADLTERIAARTADLEASNRDQRQAMSDLTKMAEELKRSNADLEQFAYAASHDLQEPLRMVRSYLQLLERRYRNKLGPEGDEFIGFAVDGAQRMSALIRGLLEYSRVAFAGGDPAATDMRAVAATAIGNLKMALDEALAVVEVAPLPVVHGEAEQLTSLLQNLIGNAVKYRRPDRPVAIRVDARRSGGNWEFSVSDNGIGIETQHLTRIFGVFQRLHTHGEYEGSGIGLALCKRIVERHGGRIWAESEPGAGSVFRFTLPA